MINRDLYRSVHREFIYLFYNSLVSRKTLFMMIDPLLSQTEPGSIRATVPDQRAIRSGTDDFWPRPRGFTVNNSWI